MINLADPRLRSLKHTRSVRDEKPPEQEERWRERGVALSLSLKVCLRRKHKSEREDQRVFASVTTFPLYRLWFRLEALQVFPVISDFALARIALSPCQSGRKSSVCAARLLAAGPQSKSSSPSGFSNNSTSCAQRPAAAASVASRIAVTKI